MERHKLKLTPKRRKTKSGMAVETHTIGDDVIELINIPWDMSKSGRWAFNLQNPRSVWCVRVNGIKRGFLVYPHGWGIGWQLYSIAPDVRSYSQSYVHLHQLDGPDKTALIAKIPEFVAKGRMPTLAEVAAEEMALAEYNRTHARECALKRRHSAKEAAARKAQAEADRLFELEGLTAIRDKFRGEMTNHMLEALGRSIERFNHGRQS